MAQAVADLLGLAPEVVSLKAARTKGLTPSAPVRPSPATAVVLVARQDGGRGSPEKQRNTETHEGLMSDSHLQLR